MAGWQVGLLAVWVSSADLSVARVADRVSQGGHNVSADDIRRRHGRARHHLRSYIQAVDRAMIFDNSAAKPRRVAEVRDGRVIVYDVRLAAELGLGGMRENR